MQIGLLLSGGGARAIVHLGVLQALDELGKPPSVISGVSAGALIAALYASGKSPKEIMALIKLHSRSSLSVTNGAGLRCLTAVFIWQLLLKSRQMQKCVICL